MELDQYDIKDRRRTSVGFFLGTAEVSEGVFFTAVANRLLLESRCRAAVTSSAEGSSLTLGSSFPRIHDKGFPNDALISDMNIRLNVCTVRSTH